MLRTFTIAVAFAALSLTTAAASAQYYPKAGDYARHSARYTEYIASCKRAATNSPKLEDEAAKKVDTMSSSEFTKQVQACQMNERVLAAKEQAAPQRVATNIPPAAYVGAGMAVGAAVVRGLNRRPPSYGGHRLTPEQRAQLDELRAIESEEVLGPRPTNSQGYLGQRRGHQPVPRGCNEVKAPSPDGKTMYVRVVCH